MPDIWSARASLSPLLLRSIPKIAPYVLAIVFIYELSGLIWIILPS